MNTDQNMVPIGCRIFCPFMRDLLQAAVAAFILNYYASRCKTYCQTWDEHFSVMRDSCFGQIWRHNAGLWGSAVLCVSLASCTLILCCDSLSWSSIWIFVAQQCCIGSSYCSIWIILSVMSMDDIALAGVSASLVIIL